MKKTALSLLSILLMCLGVTTALISCKKDELVSKELLIFVKGEYGSTNNTLTASLTRTPVSIWGNTVFDIPVYATHEVPADIDVYIYPDDRFVATYNQSNGTNYLLMPPGAYKVNNDYKHKIVAGSLVSDPINIDINNAAILTDTKGYILPLTVTKIEGKDKGAKISINQATVYIVVPYKYTNVDSVQTPLNGTLMARTGWAVTVSGSSTGTANQASNMLDGSNSTYWRSNSSTTAVKTVTLNLGSVQTVQGLQISPNYNNANENATQITVSTSSDNVTYTPQGIWKGSTYTSGTSTASPDFKGINFLVPVQARYYKLEITAWPSGGIVGMAEINAF